MCTTNFRRVQQSIIGFGKNDTVCMVRRILLNIDTAVIQARQYYIDLVYSAVDGSRPPNRPDLATRDEMQCTSPHPNKSRKTFDYADVVFVEQDTRPGWAPVTLGRGGPYSVGICN